MNAPISPFGRFAAAALAVILAAGCGSSSGNPPGSPGPSVAPASAAPTATPAPATATVAPATAAPTATPPPIATATPTATPAPTPFPVDLAVVKANLVALSKGAVFSATGTIGLEPGGQPNVSGEIIIVKGATEVSLSVISPIDQSSWMLRSAADAKTFTRHADGRWWVVQPLKGAKSHLAAVLAAPGDLSVLPDLSDADEDVVMLGTRLDTLGLGFAAVNVSGDAEPAYVMASVDRTGAVRALNIAGSWIQVAWDSQLLVGDAATPALLAVRLDPAPLTAGRTVTLPKNAWTMLESERAGYTIGTPTTWKKRARASYELYTGPGRREIGVYASDQDLALAKLLATVKVWQWSHNRIRPSSTKKITIGGETAWLMTFRTMRTYRSAAGGTFVPVLLEALVVHGGNDYYFDWYSPRADEKAGLKLFREILGTLVFTY